MPTIAVCGSSSRGRPNQITHEGDPDTRSSTNNGGVPTHLHRSRIKPDVLRSYLTMHQSIASAITQRLLHTLPRTEEPTRTLIQQLLDDVQAEWAWVNTLMVQMQMPPTRCLSSEALMGAVYPLTMKQAQPIKQALRSVTELETLTTSVTAKKALWQTLMNLTDALPANKPELRAMIQNANRQQRDLETISEHLCRGVFLVRDDTIVDELA